MANSAISATTLTDLKTRYEDGSVKIDYGVFSPTVFVYDDKVNAKTGATFKLFGSGSRTVNINNIKDGQSVTLLVQGSANTVITLRAYTDEGTTLLTSVFAAGQNGTMASNWSLFTVMRIGGTVAEGSIAIIGVMHGIQVGGIIGGGIL